MRRFCPVLVILLTLATGVPSALATNPPQLNYIQTLNSQNRPQTYFRPGSVVELRIRLYLPNHADARRATTYWVVTAGGKRVLDSTIHGGYSGPSRGDLFVQTKAFHLSSHARSGMYVATVSVSLPTAHLGRSMRFWVKG